MNPEIERQHIGHFDHAEFKDTAKYLKGRGWTLSEVSTYGTGTVWSTWTRPVRPY